MDHGEPPADCRLCPRLAEFRADNRRKFPHFHNRPVPAFGDAGAQLLIVGLAPGLRGANQTGRPFTGDYAGELLYPSLVRFGFARGTYNSRGAARGAARADARAYNTLALIDCRITNAVRCVPPKNKPTTEEIRSCRRFLATEIADMPRLAAFLALGTIAHNAILATLGERLSAWKFGHGARHSLPSGQLLFDSYHCSRYNVNTGRLTEPMFHAVLEQIAGTLRLAAVPPAGLEQT